MLNQKRYKFFLRIPGLELSEDESEDEIVDHELDVFKSLYDEQHVSIDKENQSLLLFDDDDDKRTDNNAVGLCSETLGGIFGKSQDDFNKSVEDMQDELISTRPMIPKRINALEGCSDK